MFVPKTLLVIFFIFCGYLFYSQSNYQFGLSTTRDVCLKASAKLEIFGTEPADTITILWSSGQKNVLQIQELSEGDYNVYIKIKHKKDSLILVEDTTFYFSIEKELCSVTVDKYFSPNDDNYHDKLGITNYQYHPNFEFNVFNKWGQQVHSQKQNYIPWDGKWNGIDLPDGTYYYIFFYDTDHKTKLSKGDVTILR